MNYFFAILLFVVVSLLNNALATESKSNEFYHWFCNNKDSSLQMEILGQMETFTGPKHHPRPELERRGQIETELIYKALIPLCRRPQRNFGENRMIEFYFQNKGVFLGVEGGLIGVDIWHAGRENDVLILGVSLHADNRILFNGLNVVTIHPRNSGFKIGGHMIFDNFSLRTKIIGLK